MTQSQSSDALAVGVASSNGIRYPYHSPWATRVLDLIELAKWGVRRPWRRTPEQAPLPDLLKRRVIASYARNYGLRVFVESGTYLGETISFMRKRCTQVFSVELQAHLATAAQLRFSQDSCIAITQGDSSMHIPRITAALDQAALFWLDGHFAAHTAAAGEIACPTMEELSAVLADRRFPHVVLIDDAREFRGQGGYPTLADLRTLIHSRRPELGVEVTADIIRITPPAGPQG